MARTKKPGVNNGQVTAILAADIHLREDTPICRTDDFRMAMDRKMSAIRDLQADNGECPVYVAGDIFDHWKPSPALLRWAIHRIYKWIVIPGQHDLPQHNLSQFGKSGLGVLEAAGVIEVLRDDTGLPVHQENKVQILGFPWGVKVGDLKGHKLDHRFKQVALVHHLVYSGKIPFPGAEKIGDSAKSLLKKFPGFNLVVTGDNHQQFVCAVGHGETLWIDPQEDARTAFTLKTSFPGKSGYRVLVNPGSMMRSTAKQAEHEPCVFLWYADTNTLKRVVLPHDKNVISREHIDTPQAQDERIEAFISRMTTEVEIGLNFIQNLRQYIAENDVPQPVQQKIWAAVEREEQHG